MQCIYAPGPSLGTFCMIVSTVGDPFNAFWSRFGGRQGKQYCARIARARCSVQTVMGFATHTQTFCLCTQMSLSLIPVFRVGSCGVS